MSQTKMPKVAAPIKELRLVKVQDNVKSSNVAIDSFEESQIRIKCLFQKVDTAYYFDYFVTHIEPKIIPSSKTYL